MYNHDNGVLLWTKLITLFHFIAELGEERKLADESIEMYLLFNILFIALCARESVLQPPIPYNQPG